MEFSHMLNQAKNWELNQAFASEILFQAQTINLWDLLYFTHWATNYCTFNLPLLKPVIFILAFPILFISNFFGY